MKYSIKHDEYGVGGNNNFKEDFTSLWKSHIGGIVGGISKKRLSQVRGRIRRAFGVTYHDFIESKHPSMYIVK